MRAAQRWRYYCDFCKKSGGSAHHMKRHERACTNNPARVCGMCRDTKARDVMLAAARDGIDALRAAAGGCPACMLVGVRAERDDDTPYTRSYEEKDRIKCQLSDWKFADEKKAFWGKRSHRSAHYDDGYMY